jgi:two-component system response regulator ResD
MAHSILLVDDDAKIRSMLAMFFKKENFTVAEAENGMEAIRLVEQLKPQMVILDLMMPVVDGIETCKQIRKFSNVPIIMLTAKTEDEDRILGLEIGADDYVTKPFSPMEVVARVKAVLRRVPDADFTKAEGLKLPELTIDFSGHKMVVKGIEQKMTTKETELLWLLAEHPGTTFSRETLLEKVWGYEYVGETRTVDNHVKSLRRKLNCNESTPWDIVTVWGVGYRFEVKK